MEYSNDDKPEDKTNGYWYLEFAGGVVTGKSCLDDLTCPPPAGFDEKVCTEMKTGTYKPDGTALASPSEDWTGDVSESNMYWSEIDADKSTTYYHGVLDMTAKTFTGKFGGATPGVWTASEPTCQAKGETGGPCGEERACTDATSCCGTGANTLDAEDTMADLCGDGLVADGDGFSRGGIDYKHTCSAMSLIASAGSILAATYMI
jgi:hypothetical protein